MPELRNSNQMGETMNSRKCEWGLPKTEVPIKVSELILHCFTDGKSLCGSCEQDKIESLKEITEQDLHEHKNVVCAKCYALYEEDKQR